MGKSNKPDWSDAEDWAEFIACDEDGMWYQYALEPLESDIYVTEKNLRQYHKWSNHNSCKFSSFSCDADGDWADENWGTSVEARPGSASTSEADKYKKSGPSRHKRVTLFMDYDGEIDDDDTLSHIVALMLKSRLNNDGMQVSGVAVDRIRIAVGVNKTNEINYSEDESEFFIDGEEPDHHDDDDDDEDDEF